MPNLTVRISDEAYQVAHRFAVRHKTSIASVFTDFLFSIRNCVSNSESVSPEQVVAIHAAQLIESNIGRVNLAPFNDKEWIATLRCVLKMLENKSRTETVHSCTVEE